MKRSSAAYRWRASFLAFFARCGGGPRPQRPRAAESTELFVLVQTRPESIVLAVSHSRKELDRELAELNRTWNHWAFRAERRSFEIQRAPLLIASPGDGASAKPPQRNQTSFQKKL